jgi:peptide-methionine (S)-S-oxide reductase
MSDNKQKATFGGGCFWCMEALFQTLDGVESVTSGYAGGHQRNPTYEQVCTGETGHAEVVQIVFDPEKIDYATLLKHFWKTHDPTTLHCQGIDYGTQYRSIILTHDETQREIAEKSKQTANAEFSDPITTEIAPLDHFYPAEPTHRDYYRTHPGAPYCTLVIQPKLDDFLQVPRTASLPTPPSTRIPRC